MCRLSSSSYSNNDLNPSEHTIAFTALSGVKLLAAATISSETLAHSLLAGFVSAVALQFIFSITTGGMSEATIDCLGTCNQLCGSLTVGLYALQFLSINKISSPILSAYNFGFMAGQLTSRTIIYLVYWSTMRI